jgi:hypothetical protein
MSRADLVCRRLQFRMQLVQFAAERSVVPCEPRTTSRTSVEGYRVRSRHCRTARRTLTPCITTLTCEREALGRRLPARPLVPRVRAPVLLPVAFPLVRDFFVLRRLSRLLVGLSPACRPHCVRRKGVRYAENLPLTLAPNGNSMATGGTFLKTRREEYRLSTVDETRGIR